MSAIEAPRLLRRSPVHTLFWRMFLVNGVIVGLALAFLAFSPTTVSTPVLAREIVVLATLLLVVVGANALVLRASLRPLGSLSDLMHRVGLLDDRVRVDARGNSDLAPVIESFNKMLDRLEHEHARASSDALAAQERERQRIAQELHDEIGQTLTVALLNLKPAIEHVDAEGRPSLLATQESIRSAIEEVRQIARRLRPDVLAELGLMSALNALTTEFSQASGITVDRQFAHPMPYLDSDSELVCYRIAQECLTNVARHADAGHVTLGLSESDGSLVLSVQDDGKGGVFRAGAGIRGMRERALLIGAELSIDSLPGAGTSVKLRMPQGLS